MLLYRRSFAIDSALPPGELRDRIRFMVEHRLVPQTRQFRFRQIAGWAYREADGRFMLRPDPWSGGIFGVQFVGRVEEEGSGSRIVGFVREHWLIQVIATLLLLGTAAMMLASLREHPWAD